MGKKATLQFLGTGASAGVPIIGCRCLVCTSCNPKDSRGRSHALLKVEGQQFLIDASPELRSNCLRYGVDQLDGVVITHFHNDHIAAFEDLKAFAFHSKKPLKVLLLESTYRHLQERFDYLVSHQLDYFEFITLTGKEKSVDFAGISVGLMTYKQGSMEVLGLRFGSLAYVIDMKSYNESIFHALSGVETLVMTLVKKESSKMHLGYDEVADFVNRTGAKKAIYTHVSHEIMHAEMQAMLKDKEVLGFDGMEVPFVF